MIIPATVTAISEYSEVAAVKSITTEMSSLLKKAVAGVVVLEKAECAKGQIAAMNELRASVDALEAIVPADLWPMPSYADILRV